MSKKWLNIWIIVAVISMAYYPVRTSFIGGWMPWSVVLSFGWMWVVFVIAILFCRSTLGKNER
jgi:hypothetical protein